MARLDCAKEIAGLIRHHLQTHGSDLLPDAAAVADASRLQRTRQLVSHLESHSALQSPGA